MENMITGEITRKRSYEVQHKVKFGQLGSPMTATTGNTLQDMKNLYKALADTFAFPR